jgi:hypothetical protein
LEQKLAGFKRKFTRNSYEQIKICKKINGARLTNNGLAGKIAGSLHVQILHNLQEKLNNL